MEHLKRLATFQQASTTLKEALDEFQSFNSNQRYYGMSRDSLIQRYEYSIDIFWKLLKQHLEINYKIETLGSPKSIFKLCYEMQLVSDDEYKIALRMLEDRNLTSHAYNVELAEQIAHAIPEYYYAMQSITQRIFKT